MAYKDISTEGMNYVTLRQVMDDFMLGVDVDDYISSVNDAMLRNIALRGIREFGFDISKRIKSLKTPIASNSTVPLPSDYVDLLKVGIVDGDGIVCLESKQEHQLFAKAGRHNYACARQRRANVFISK